LSALKSEPYTEWTPEEQENLDLARGLLKYIVKVATGKASSEHKIGQIQRGYGEANEALNRVAALHGISPKGAQMMSIDFEREPDYEKIIDILIGKDQTR